MSLVETTASPHSSLQAAPAVDAGPPWIRRGRVPGLDGLRAISILFVLLGHAKTTPGFPSSIARGRDELFRTLATRGVDVFFVISGFLITLLLFREFDKTSTISLRGFYKRRALRILPTYVAYILVVAVFAKVGYVEMRVNDWLRALTYTVNWFPDPALAIGHIWSLSLEEHFYLLWPPIFVLLGTTRARYFALGCLVAEPVARHIVFRYLSGVLIFERFTLTRLDAIAAGCFMAFLAADARSLARVRQTGISSFWLFGIGLMSILLSDVVLGRSGKYRIYLRDDVNAVAICLMVWAIVFDPGAWLTRLLNTRAFVAVGIVSYSLYLWQQLFMLPHAAFFTLRAWPWNLLTTIIVAVASYFLIESPFLRLKSRVSRAQ